MWASCTIAGLLWALLLAYGRGNVPSEGGGDEGRSNALPAWARKLRLFGHAPPLRKPGK